MVLEHQEAVEWNYLLRPMDPALEEPPAPIGPFAQTYIYDVIEEAVAELQSQQPQRHAGCSSSSPAVSPPHRGSAGDEGSADASQSPLSVACHAPPMDAAHRSTSVPGDVTFTETLSPTIGTGALRVARRIKSDSDHRPLVASNSPRVRQGLQSIAPTLEVSEDMCVM